MLRIALFSLALALVACGPNQPDAATAGAPVPVTHTEKSDVVSHTQAVLAIGGMTCAHGCGGVIQARLQDLPGVNGTDLDYADGRSANSVTVDYDPNRISEQELIQCVQGIADGKYPVQSAEVIHYTALQVSGSASGNGPDISFGRVFQLFNLLNSLSELVR